MTEIFYSKRILDYILIALAILSSRCNSLDKRNPKHTKVVNVDSIKLGNRFDVHANMNCERNDLSSQFNVAINFIRYSDTTKLNDSNIIRVYLRDKKSTSLLDALTITSLYYFGDGFANCDGVISYSTGINVHKEISDNYFGDLVIADLNFDNLDDIAVITDFSADSGPYYSYFIQTPKKKFVLDHYLTDSVCFFPSKIDKSNNRLITRVHAGACCVGVDTYQFSKSAQKWKHVSHKQIPPSKAPTKR